MNPEVLQVAERVFDELPEKLQHEVREFLHGVFVGDSQPIERYAQEIYLAYEPVRDVLRLEGNAVLLFRGEPIEKPKVKRVLLSWSPFIKMSALFAERIGYEVVGAQVKVDDVAAVFLSPTNRRYVEFLVRERHEYHHQMHYDVPMLGYVTFDVEPFSRNSVASAARQLRSQLRSMGGRLIYLKIDEREECAWASVTLPQDVVNGEYYINVGGFTAEAFRPYTGLIR